MGYDNIITCAEDLLVTPYEQTRAGFIEAAIAKGYKAKPYIEQAKTLKSLAQKAATPMDLLAIEEIQSSLLLVCQTRRSSILRKTTKPKRSRR